MEIKIFKRIIAYRRIIRDFVGSLKVENYVHTSKNIRSIGKEDLRRVLVLDELCFKRKNNHLILRYSRLFKNIFYVSEKNGEIIAYIGFYVHLKFRKFRIIQEAVCFSGCIDEQHRGTGLYTMMYRDCLLELKNNGIKTVSVCIRKNNFASLRVHQKLGFRTAANDYTLCGTEEYTRLVVSLDDLKEQ